jgi:malic enzyme
VLEEPLAEQRFVFLGAGAAGIGIARLVRAALEREGASRHAIREAIVMLDSKGLLYEGRVPLDKEKEEFALEVDQVRGYGFESAAPHDLETVIRHVKPAILIGTSGTPGSFTEGAIREMGKHARVPVVMPLSNPTSKTEAVPADILEWTEGRAIAATGSPFDPVKFADRTHIIGQSNNAFVFPGIGLGMMVAEAREVTDDMFLTAARTLAEMLTPERLAAGAVYPSQSDLRRASQRIAVAVVREARDEAVGRMYHDDEIEGEAGGSTTVFVFR